MVEDDHRLLEGTWPVEIVRSDQIVTEQRPALNAVNERLRDEYIADCKRGMTRWNRAIKKFGIDFQFKLPHRGFHRQIGHFSDLKISPRGKVVSEADWTRHHADWMPSEDDRAFVTSLMHRVVEPGKIAGWVAPPARGINHEDPETFEYIRFN
jgi:benzoyl-CoA 2,3-dioxygenase component B